MAFMPGLAGLAFLLSILLVSPVSAEDSWNPFRDADKRTERTSRSRTSASAPLPPPDADSGRPWNDDGAPSAADEPAMGPSDRPAPWAQPGTRTGDWIPGTRPPDSVERSELQPLAPSGTTATFQPELQGVDPAHLRDLIAPLTIPPRSAALAGVWRRQWLGGGFPRSSVPAVEHPSLFALRIDALYRSGSLAELAEVVRAPRANAEDPALALLIARVRILLGERDAGCSELKRLQRAQRALPKSDRHEFLLLAALCGVGDRDPGAAGLAADLLRSEGVEAPVALAALDTIAAANAGTFKPPSLKRISLLDYRFLQLARTESMPDLLPAAEPAVLVTVATSASDVAMRIQAAEAALSIDALTPAELAAAYRSAVFSQHALAAPLADRQEPPLKRALLFKAFEAERTPIRKARLARALLDEVRRTHGPYLQTAALLSSAVTELRPAPEIGWFAETAIEIGLASEQFAAVKPWTEPPLGERYGGLRHWLVLADIADPKRQGRRGEDLSAVEHFAIRGRLAPELMHRLVTVLDALDYQIPIPLWEAASRSPQPATGHLPDTGVLTELQDASRRQDHMRVALLAMSAVGPDPAEAAHMITLGDTIRALKQAGMEPEARRFGLEALFSAWPRNANN